MFIRGNITVLMRAQARRQNLFTLTNSYLPLVLSLVESMATALSSSALVSVWSGALVYCAVSL